MDEIQRKVISRILFLKTSFTLELSAVFKLFHVFSVLRREMVESTDEGQFCHCPPGRHQFPEAETDLFASIDNLSRVALRDNRVGKGRA